MKKRVRGVIFTVLILGTTMLSAGCGSKNWVEDMENSCKVFDSHPVDTQTLRWEGPCKEGVASDYGLLKVYEEGKPAFEVKGTMVEGKLHGLVAFTIIGEAKDPETYEERWEMGKRKKRLKNLSLETALAGAGNAREYLHELARYRKGAPKAWLDHFHKVLLEKITFACGDMDVNIPGVLSGGGAFSEGSTATKGTRAVKRGRVRKGELLLKTWNHVDRKYVYRTVYNHPTHTVKSLMGDDHIPGGEQFSAVDPPGLCEGGEVPDALPVSCNPVRIYGGGEKMGDGIREEAGTRWYPMENPRVAL